MDAAELDEQAVSNEVRVAQVESTASTEPVVSVVSSAVQTRAQVRRPDKQMARLHTSLPGQVQITTEEFMKEQR